MNERSAMAEEIETRLSDPTIYVDPYPTYSLIREQGPAYWSDAWGVWLITGYEEVADSLRDWENFSNDDRFITLLDHLTDDERTEVEPLGRFFAIAKGLIHRDPPEHTRLRKLLSRAFTNRVVERMEQHIQDIVDELLDHVQGDGHMDVVDDLALPLPAIVIAELLGIPAEDRRFFVTWSAEAVSFAGTANPPLELVKKAQHGYLSLYEYFTALIEERRKGAGLEFEDPDLVTLLLDAGKENVLSDDELVSTCVTLLIGGFETTTSLIANTLHLLLTHPEQRAALEADPSLMAGTIEESLRYESPLQILPRRVSRPVRIDGRELEPGQLVFEMLGAANRDPAKFPDPDRFDIGRDPRHLAFGMGIHLCVGAPLARLEAPIALSSILRRMPGVEMAEDEVRWNVWKPTARGPLAYHVAF